MDRTDDIGGHAFPLADVGIGMTLRDYFAGQALIGFTASSNWPIDRYAEASYAIADAMLAERAK